MPLLKADRPVRDGWRALAVDEPVPADGRIVVPLAHLQAEAAAFEGFAGELGVRLEPVDRVEGLAPWLARLGLVVVHFPVFNDGRGCSTARILRQRYRYRGELRAAGNVLVDQHQFLRQCGFDAFEVAEGRAWESWRRATVAVSLTYQPDYAQACGPEAIWDARRRQRTIAAIG
jgi:uncharacterized protein (DUF934 family)